MIANKVSATILLNAALYIGVKADVNSLSATRHRVRLYPDPGPECYTRSGRRKGGRIGDARYQRESVRYGTAGRRVNAVCWHGFRDYFRTVYAQCPDAKFRTGLARYDNNEHFERVFPETGHKNIGPMSAPVAIASACRCPESGEVSEYHEFRYLDPRDPRQGYVPQRVQDDYGQDEADGAACRAMAAILRGKR